MPTLDHRTWNPRIVAHRGISAHYPENTAPAFAAAVAAEVAGIELDLQLSRDGQVVVYHDHRLAKLGLRSRHIRDLDWTRLATLDAGAWKGAAFVGTRMLRLDEVLAHWGGRTRLLLEIKAHGRNRRGSRDLQLTEAAMALLLSRTGSVRDHLAILSFSDAVLARAHALCQAQGLPTPELVRNLEHPGELRATRVTQLQIYAAICVDINRFDVSDVARVHRHGLPLYAYTVDTPAQVRHARTLGCSLLICNDPQRVRTLVAEGADDA